MYREMRVVRVPAKSKDDKDFWTVYFNRDVMNTADHTYKHYHTRRTREEYFILRNAVKRWLDAGNADAIFTRNGIYVWTHRKV